MIQKEDPDAVIAVFPADHLIEPADRFRDVVARGYTLAELAPSTLVTFGIEPTFASTGFGYLQLGESIEEGARIVARFKEKPEAATAQAYFEAGPRRFLWNSGMFVWRASTPDGLDLPVRSGELPRADKDCPALGRAAS